MKKNLVMRIAAVVLMCTLVTACFASSTFAKYTSQATASSKTVTVAKWAVELDGNGIVAADPQVEFDLWDTLLDSDKTNAEKNATTIAPGTSGKFDFELENKSDVDANAKVEITIPAGFPSAIVFTYNGTDYTPSATQATKIVIDNIKLKGIDTTDAAYTSATFKPEISWVWAFTDTNENALAGTILPQITAVITVDQAD